ncbi:MAG TPA: hypothetical protein IAA67_07605 [Candidatus Avoscillospira stercorigallinarum]|uniref:Anti-sigma factor RsgI-like middle domain-containing protein n=1 Tax=Candidatus Avoscillospira stercorigallinarum TaxID=2840708 RepID=A0A9D1CNV1_9FIRM|nr:hypothetical protein [Candidatus Avoscillospira stercorigallinarum]
MNYLVMEVHPAYAVVLDEEGRFLKTANLRYQVGDTVQDIVELRRPQEKRPSLWKPLSGLAALAACLCLVFFGYYQPNFTPYGALRIQINPDVELTLSRTDRVLELEGLNEDGQALIEGYDYQGKDRENVTGALVERAIDQGYLSGGETVSITVTSSDADWQAREEQEVRDDLEERYGETIVIQIGSAPTEPPVTEVVIPVTPATPEPAPPAVPDDPEDSPGSVGETGDADRDDDWDDGDDGDEDDDGDQDDDVDDDGGQDDDEDDQDDDEDDQDDDENDEDDRNEDD